MTIADWTGNEEDKADENVWEDNWDDDNVEDDFSQQLRYSRHFIHHCAFITFFETDEMGQVFVDIVFYIEFLNLVCHGKL